MSDRWIGLGISTIWGLPEDHRLHIAAAHHDASHDAIDLLLGSMVIFEIPKHPIYYKELVSVKLQELVQFISNPDNSNYEFHYKIKLFAKEKDLEFFTICTNLKESWFTSFQSYLFYKIVKIYTLIKFKESYVQRAMEFNGDKNLDDFISNAERLRRNWEFN